MQQLGYDDDVKGVVVIDVEPLSPARRAGIQVRDVIVSVQDRSVEDVGGFRDVLKEYNLKEGVCQGVRTGTMRRFVFLQVGE